MNSGKMMKLQNGKNQESAICGRKGKKVMKEMFTVLVLMVVISLFSMVQAFDGPPSHERMPQLPPDKERLFHQTMSEVQEATMSIREQIKGVEAEIRGIVIAPEFNEVLFLERTRRLQDLHKMESEAMDMAVVKLAKQFTIEERKILAEIIFRKPGPPGSAGPPTPQGPLPPGPRR